jgi:hypothetical protein
MNYSAYLIVVCNQDTNAIEDVCIWSSPEWEQSRCLPDKYTYVAYAMRGKSYQDAHDHIVTVVRDVPRCSRLHRLWPLLREHIEPQANNRLSEQEPPE